MHKRVSILRQKKSLTKTINFIVRYTHLSVYVNGTDEMDGN
jgi:hypothetical protein